MAVNDPSVTMNALTPTICTKTALIVPAATPAPSASATAPTAPMWSIVISATAPANAATDPIDKSKLPEISTTVMKIAKIP
jgi:hypothetical protein